MRHGKDEDDDIENEIGKGEREVKRQDHDTMVAVLGLELLPQDRRRDALQREREDVRDAPGGREPDDDVVDDDEGPHPEDPPEEEQHRQLDQAEPRRPDHLVRVPRLLVDVQLRRVAW